MRHDIWHRIIWAHLQACMLLVVYPMCIVHHSSTTGKQLPGLQGPLACCKTHSHLQESTTDAHVSAPLLLQGKCAGQAQAQEEEGAAP